MELGSITINSQEELEDLYTSYVITYYQYLNLKEKFKNESSDEDDE